MASISGIRDQFRQSASRLVASESRRVGESEDGDSQDSAAVVKGGGGKCCLIDLDSGSSSRVRPTDSPAEPITVAIRSLRGIVSSLSDFHLSRTRIVLN